MRSIIAVGALAALVLMTAGAAAAAEQQMRQLRVEGSRTIVEKDAPTLTGITTKSVSLSYQVNLDDLDLNTSTGVSAAESRINTAAEVACKELGAKYPEAKPTDAACILSAIRRPMAKLHSVTARPR